MAATCAVCAIDPATVAAACAGASQRAAATALGVPKTTLLRHLATHTATVQATVPAGPVAVQAAPVQVQASVPVAAPASPGAAQGRPCATCISAHRSAIEDALARGRGYRAIEAIYRADGGPSDTSIRHHAVQCCPSALAKAADLRAAAVAMTATKAMEWIAILMPRIEGHLDRVEAGGSLGEMTAAYRELRASIETLAKITGEIGADIEIKVTQSRDYALFKSLVASTLCPSCMAALGAALTAAEAS